MEALLLRPGDELEGATSLRLEGLWGQGCPPYTAIAMLHHLTVVTRTIDDVAGCGVRLLNPFQAH